MGFKKLNSQTPKDENDFVNSARGETNSKKTVDRKRNKKLVVNFTEEEYQILNQEASSIGLSLNSYIRFKIFRKE